ncbi:MAG: hypothetical protein IJ894_08445 [Bacteroidales bacterium]|nr:hypothetical protein [Bacteroidales bacterium]
MAVKRYTPKYAKKYEYTDPETGAVDVIPFVANANLLPVFKSIAGVELTVALDEYTDNIIKMFDEQNVGVVVQFDEADTAEAKMDVIRNNTDAFVAMMRVANDMAFVAGSGFSLIELLLNAAHICTLPESDWAEATALGIELLPQEVYTDIAFAFEIVRLVFDWVNFAKKNSLL